MERHIIPGTAPDSFDSDERSLSESPRANYDEPAQTIIPVQTSNTEKNKPQRSSLVHTVTVEHVDHAGKLSEYRADWSRLSADALQPNVLLDPAFAYPALSHLESGNRVEFTLIWLATNSKEAQKRQLIGLFPTTTFRYRWGLPIRGMRAWEHIHSFQTTPLLDKTHARIAAQSFFHALKSDTTRPRFLLYQLLPKGTVWEIFKQAFAQNDIRFDEHENRERAMLKPESDDGEAYLRQSLGKKRSKEYRRLLNRLGDSGAVEFRTADNPIYIANAAERFLELEARGWKGKRHSAFNSSASGQSFFRETVADLSLTGNCAITELTLGDQVLASVAIVTSGRQSWMWKIAYDESYARFSPGVLLVLEVTKSLIGNSAIDFVDSCALPDHPMINNIWRERLPLTDVLITLRPGFIPAAIINKLEALRRRARARLKVYFNKYIRR